MTTERVATPEGRDDELLVSAKLNGGSKRPALRRFWIETMTGTHPLYISKFTLYLNPLYISKLHQYYNNR